MLSAIHEYLLKSSHTVEFFFRSVKNTQKSDKEFNDLYFSHFTFSYDCR